MSIVNKEQKKALLSPSYFCENVLDLEVKDFHEEWLDFQTKNRKSIILAPRSSGKSTIGNWGYVLWRLINDPSLRILICSNTQSQAESFLVPIKRHLSNNRKILKHFGEFEGKSDTWTTKAIDIPSEGDSSAKKEKSITTLGAGSSLVGRHYSVIILDDIVDEENSRTELQRERVYDWYYNVLLPMLEPQGELHVLGTRWHRDDIYSRLIDSGNYPYKVYKALNEDSDGNEYALWPERYSVNDLHELKQEAGTVHFNLQYQNRVMESGVSPVKKDWISYYKDYPSDVDIYQGIDISGGSAKGDYFAIATIGMDKQGNIYVLDTYQEKISLYKQGQAIKKYAMKWDPLKIGFESNALQKAISKDMLMKGIPIKSLHHKRSKEDRLSRISVYFELGNVFLKKNQNDLITQLMAATKASHDDLLDAFMMAIETAIPQREKMSNKTWGDIHDSIRIN